MKIRPTLIVVFLSMLMVTSILPAASLRLVHGQNLGQAADASKPSAQTSMGGLKRAARAGDFQTVLDFPSSEHSSKWATYLPKARDLSGYCRAQTQSYDDLLS